MVALSPWPEDPTERAAAIARLREAVAGRAVEDEAANDLGATAAELVEAYAPGAPQAVRDEAAIRVAGFLAGSDYGGIVKENIGPRDVTYATAQGALFYRCGAAGLLSRWRVRRAGVAG